jgi:hypothetical protein
MIRKMLICIFIILSINRLLPLYAQNSISNISEVLGEDILSILRDIDETRVKEQSEILSLDDLPGSFWVSIIPYEKGGFSSFDGYIFLNNNCILDVWGFAHQNDVLSALSISPTLYIMMIRGEMTYDINDDKIIFMDKVYFYLEDTYLYALYGDEYRRFRLESRFSILN